MTVSLNGTSGIVFNDASTQNTSAFTGGFAFRNRLINSDMRIDQRNAGAATTPTGSGYTSCDRWNQWVSQASKYSVQRSTVAPAGFVNSQLITSLSSYSVGASDTFALSQQLEGNNVADLGFGAAGASTVTLSFWVRSSLTGTFGGALANSAVNRSYPFSYTISAANTWEQKTITVAGDTTGTWLTDTGIGLRVWFSLGAGSTYLGTAGAWAAADYRGATGQTSVVGTSGATFYITGVQLEKGSTATSFDYRPIGTELALCQRYYYKQQATGTLSIFGSGFNNSATLGVYLVNFPVALRIDPAALEQSGTAANYQVYYGGNVTVCSAVPSFNSGNVWGSCVLFSVASGLTTGQASLARSASASAYLAWSAEL